MEIIKYPNENTWPALLKRPEIDTLDLESVVSGIIQEVRINGDSALRRYAKKFHDVDIALIAVAAGEIFESEKAISLPLKQAMNVAFSNISRFHNSQKLVEPYVDTMPGVRCWRKSIPIQKIGLYIPGGTAPLFSTVLMLGIPAKMAGCTDIIICTPSDTSGKINDAILYAAHLCGITKIYKVGGAQAIAAMAFGTETIQKVDKIFGPGNQYVTCAKKLLQKDGIAIDMPAGPSELAILADRFANPAFIAADLLSQAEHGKDSQTVLVIDYEPLAIEVIAELEKQMVLLPRKEAATQAMSNSKIIITKTLEEGMHLLNEYAPEHLILAVSNPSELEVLVVNAGSVFLGNYSPESAGDYASGTNHTLPTNGYAKSYSGVSLDSFVKKVTFQKLTKQGLYNLAPTIIEMAEAEGLQAHANAVKIRII